MTAAFDRDTIRFGGTGKGLADCNLKYYRISGRARGYKLTLPAGGTSAETFAGGAGAAAFASWLDACGRASGCRRPAWPSARAHLPARPGLVAPSSRASSRVCLSITSCGTALVPVPQASISKGRGQQASYDGPDLWVPLPENACARKVLLPLQAGNLQVMMRSAFTDNARTCLSKHPLHRLRGPAQFRKLQCSHHDLVSNSLQAVSSCKRAKPGAISRCAGRLEGTHLPGMLDTPAEELQL